MGTEITLRLALFLVCTTPATVGVYYVVYWFVVRSVAVSACYGVRRPCGPRDDRRLLTCAPATLYPAAAGVCYVRVCYTAI